MKTLSRDLKQMLAGLAAQDAGEFLSMRKKMDVLSAHTGTLRHKNHAHTKTASNRRIGLIVDSMGKEAPVAHAIEACQRQEAMIDLLIQGDPGESTITDLEQQAHKAGLLCQRIYLNNDGANSVVDYVNRHSSILFLVAMLNSPISQALVEEALPKRFESMSVPLILIGEQPAPSRYTSAIT